MPNRSALSALYYALAVVGLLATWYYNGQYLMNGGGLAPDAFFGAAFANPLTTAITIDVYLSALVFTVWVVSDARRHRVKRAWLYVVLCFCIGLAISFPLYLANRERAVLDARLRPNTRQ